MWEFGTGGLARSRQNDARFAQPTANMPRTKFKGDYA